MKFVSYSLQRGVLPKIGFLQRDWIVDLHQAGSWLKKNRPRSREFPEVPATMGEILTDWNGLLPSLRAMANEFVHEQLSGLEVNGKPVAVDESSVHYYPPVPVPPSFRDFYAFEQHVMSARKSRGLPMDPTWYKIPVFYYSNPNCLFGHREDVPRPSGTNALDFELELGIFIAGGGRDIRADRAEPFIAGFTIINDWSSRDVQREEMRLSLGPAKGKDFATSVGPYLVTPDELRDNWKDGKLNLSMKAFRNGEQLSSGNANDLFHPWEKMIERASLNTPLMPGDLFGSGTVGSGCILELKPENAGGWLNQGDVIRLEIEKLGVLENRIV
ncbi:MAG: fumarylacetoacetate hydrolase family protein [Fidelibacterota bacterium]